MRKIFITTRLVLISLVATASQHSSQLCLTAEQNKLFRVSIDQAPFSAPGKSIMIDCIEPGYHFVSVVGCSPFNPVYKTGDMLFRNYVFIPASSKITAFIDCNHAFVVSALAPVCNQPNLYNEDCNLKKRIPFPCSNRFIPMCEVDFTQFKMCIASKNFDSSRLQIAEQAITSNHFTTRQVTELIGLMTFESSRLEIAQQAYSHTLDKQNYYQVNDSFTFESTISELNHFIERS